MFDEEEIHSARLRALTDEHRVQPIDFIHQERFESARESAWLMNGRKV